MKTDEVRRVSVNECVRDDELKEFEFLCSEADPGDWRVVDGEVRRYGGAPFERREASLRLMARAITAIPRLTKGIRVLEEALRSAWIETASWKRGAVAERERHEADIARAFKGQTGPESDLDALAEAIDLDEFSHQPGSIGSARHRRDWLARILRAWASGVSIQEHPHLRVDLESARRRKAENDRIRVKIAADDARARAEIRALLEELKLKKHEREQIAEHARARAAAKEDGR
jgi:hypothetical protein